MAFWGIFEQYVGTIIILAWPPKLYDLQGGHVYIFKKKKARTPYPPRLGLSGSDGWTIPLPWCWSLPPWLRGQQGSFAPLVSSPRSPKEQRRQRDLQAVP